MSASAYGRVSSRSRGGPGAYLAEIPGNLVRKTQVNDNRGDPPTLSGQGSDPRYTWWLRTPMTKRTADGSRRTHADPAPQSQPPREAVGRFGTRADPAARAALGRRDRRGSARDHRAAAQEWRTEAPQCRVPRLSSVPLGPE